MRYLGNACPRTRPVVPKKTIAFGYHWGAFLARRVEASTLGKWAPDAAWDW